MALPFLQSIGLTKNEADIYELLLRLGEVPASTVIAESKLKRPTVYNALHTLQAKKLVTSRDIKKKIHFRPESPIVLLTEAEQRFQEASQTRNMLQTVIPQLLSNYTTSTEKPIVQIFEGVDGMKKAHKIVLNERKEILAYVHVGEAITSPLDDFWPWYYNFRIKNNIFVKAIAPNDKAGIEYQKLDSKELRETRLVPMGKFPIGLEKNIVGNKVVFFAADSDRLISTVIDNKTIADTERAIFDLAWERAEHYNQLLNQPYQQKPSPSEQL